MIFHVKDHSRRWVSCNQAALKLLRREDLLQIVGAREEDVFPTAAADAIKEDDLRIDESKCCTSTHPIKGDIRCERKV